MGIRAEETEMVNQDEHEDVILERADRVGMGLEGECRG